LLMTPEKLVDCAPDTSCHASSSTFQVYMVSTSLALRAWTLEMRVRLVVCCGLPSHFVPSGFRVMMLPAKDQRSGATLSDPPVCRRACTLLLACIDAGMSAGSKPSAKMVTGAEARP